MSDQPAVSRPSERAADAVVRELEARIISGALPDGAHLPPERDLIDAFGVSRTVVREAVARLASRGFVDSRPRFRPVVRRPGPEAALAAAGNAVGHLLGAPDGIRNLHEARVLIEAGLVREAALHARKDGIQALVRALDANEAAVHDPTAFFATDMALHGVFYDLPRNPILPAVHKALTAWLSGPLSHVPRTPHRNRVNVLRHREIVEAIRERDPDAAETALRAHLAGSWEDVRATFHRP